MPGPSEFSASGFSPAALTSGDLSVVTGESPPAVLLVDLRTGQVVYTSPVAEQLAPRLELPVTLDQWSDAAELRDPDGAPLSETDHPLSQVARSLPVPGQAVSAARVSDLGRRREPLWVVALPMLDAPMLPEHALVVLLPLDRRHRAEEASDAARAQVQLRERAVLATTLAIVVADARRPDVPLVWVNPAFTATTGYSFEEAVGRNCRFLQGPATDPEATAALRRAVAEGREVVTTLVNYRKDGTAFSNQLSVSPIRGPDGTLTHFVGIQADVTARVTADAERERALAAERRARRDAETAQADAEAARADAERAWAAAERSRTRLELLVEATTRLSDTLDVVTCRRRLVDLVVPRLADWAMVISTTPAGAVTDITAEHRDPAHAAGLEEHTRLLRRALRPGSARLMLPDGQEFRRISDFDDVRHHAERGTWVRDPGVLASSDALGAASVLVLALPGRRDSHDLLVLVRGGGTPATATTTSNSPWT